MQKSNHLDAIKAKNAEIKSNEKQIFRARMSFTNQTRNKYFVFEWSRFCSRLCIRRDRRWIQYSNIDNARILESDQKNDWAETYSRIWCKQWRRFSKSELVHCFKFRAIQVRQKLVISNMSRRHWHDDKMKYYDTKIIVRLVEFKKKNVVDARQILIEHLMWNASWNQYENIVNRIKREMIHRTLNTILACKKRS